MRTEPTILHASGGADFLAMLPTLAGCTVRESILIVPFAGTRTMGVMRIDLPSQGAPYDRLGSIALGSMSRLEGCDGVILAAYTDATFPVAFAQWERLIAALDERFESAGFTVKDAYCVAQDGWASWYEPSPPFDGHPRSEIDESPMAAHAAEVRGGAPLTAHTAAGSLPPADPETAGRLTAMVDGLISGHELDAFGRWQPANIPDAIAFIEELLERDADDTPLPMLARLALHSMRPDRRDEMVLQIAFGRAVGERARADSERRHEVQRTQQLSMDEIVAAETAQSDGRPDEQGELFLGESVREPHVVRVRRAIDILRRTIVHLDPDLRPDLLCMLAWLHWAVGASSAAGHHVESALRIDPEHTLAAGLLALIESGKVPEWVYAAHGSQRTQNRAQRRSGRRATKAAARMG